MGLKYDAVVGQKYMAGGQEKTKWQKIGVVFENDKGQLSLKLDVVPVGNFDGWVKFFEPRQNVQPPASQVSQGQAPDNGGGALSDEIPFAALHHHA